MKMTHALKGSLMVAALVAAPFVAAHADAETDSERSSIIGRCQFDAGDQEQGDDCWVKFKGCIRSDANPTVSPSECREFLKVRCGRRTVFAGDFETFKRDGKIILKGEPNGHFHKPVTLAFEAPRSLPDEVHARLHIGDIDRHGKCFIRYEDKRPEAPGL